MNAGVSRSTQDYATPARGLFGGISSSALQVGTPYDAERVLQRQQQVRSARVTPPWQTRENVETREHSPSGLALALIFAYARPGRAKREGAHNARRRRQTLPTDRGELGWASLHPRTLLELRRTYGQGRTGGATGSRGQFESASGNLANLYQLVWYISIYINIKNFICIYCLRLSRGRASSPCALTQPLTHPCTGYQSTLVASGSRRRKHASARGSSTQRNRGGPTLPSRKAWACSARRSTCPRGRRISATLSIELCAKGR